MGNITKETVVRMLGYVAMFAGALCSSWQMKNTVKKEVARQREEENNKEED